MGSGKDTLLQTERLGAHCGGWRLLIKYMVIVAGVGFWHGVRALDLSSVLAAGVYSPVAVDPGGI